MKYKEGFIIYKQLLMKYQHLEDQIHSLQIQLKALPPGKLTFSRTGNRYKWYQSDGHHQVYIPKKNQHLAEQLAVKKYLSSLLQDLTTERDAIHLYLSHHSPDPTTAGLLLSQNSEYKKLLAPYFSPVSEELSDWMNASYEHNTAFPEQLIHKNISGHLVRSKSEAIIDTFLYHNKIPFRYECALHLGEATLFPDFTIRHPKTGDFYYWEHFGMMDQAAYSKNAYSKLQLYASYEIIPTIQLITTYETKSNPLNADIVEKIIHHYFL